MNNKRKMKKKKKARHSQARWLTPIILATQRWRSGESTFEASLGKYCVRPCLKKTQHQTGLVEWLTGRVPA
jgi:hypothetical protein